MFKLFFYPNNLLNSFLFDKFPDVYSTPLCDCGESAQTMCHILFECKGSLSMPNDAAHQLRERICEAETNCFSNMHVQDFCIISAKCYITLHWSITAVDIICVRS